MTFRSKLTAVLSALWSVFIFSNSLKTGTESALMSNSIVSEIIKYLSLPIETETLTFIIRKVAHFSEFLLLGFLISLCFYYSKKRFQYNIYTILFLCLSSGVIDEFLQSFIIGRSSEVRDVLIDFAGGIVGLILVYFMDKHRFQKKVH